MLQDEVLAENELLVEYNPHRALSPHWREIDAIEIVAGRTFATASRYYYQNCELPLSGLLRSAYSMG
jgi:hypothetical protein